MHSAALNSTAVSGKVPCINRVAKYQYFGYIYRGSQRPYAGNIVGSRQLCLTKCPVLIGRQNISISGVYRVSERPYVRGIVGSRQPCPAKCPVLIGWQNISISGIHRVSERPYVGEAFCGVVSRVSGKVPCIIRVVKISISGIYKVSQRPYVGSIIRSRQLCPAKCTILIG